jgi:arylsulfatase A-like enzyme
MTGRYSIRSGNHSVPLGTAGGWGPEAWETTLGDLLSAAGYGCAVYGKWHVGGGAGTVADRQGVRGMVRAATHVRRSAMAG